MKIAINTRLLLPNKLEGLGWFTHEVCQRITTQHPEHEFIFLFDRKFDPQFIYSKNITPFVVSPQARHPFLFYWWFEFSITKILKKEKVDLFLSPDGYLSLSTNVPSIAVIHDLNFEHYPKDLPWLVRKYYRYFFPKFAKKATRIITVSNFSKQDIHHKYNISKSNIDVAYNGINHKYHPISDANKKAVKDKYSSGKDYFIFIGSLHPRKNISRLLNAFEIFKNETNSDLKLIIIGDKYWWNIEMEANLQHNLYKEEIIFLGHLPNKELNDLLSSALALTYISYFEGFGIPLIEAMQCETPIICSNATALPEIAHDAAIYVDPFDVRSITNGMIQLYQNKELQIQLIEKGKKRKMDFNWQFTSEAVWKTIEKVIHEIES